MFYADIGTWGECPIKSRVMPDGGYVSVAFDDKCPTELAFLGLPFIERKVRRTYSVDDEWRWPADMSMEERETAVRRVNVVGEEVVQRVPVVEKDSPCFDCTRGGTLAVSSQTRVKPKKSGGRRTRRKS